MKSNASLVYNLFLVVGDFLALVAAFIGAYFLRANSRTPVAHPIHGTTYLGIFLAVLPFWILIFALLGLYNSNIYERRFSEFGRLLVGSFIGMLFVIFLNFTRVQPIFPAKLVPIYGFVLAFIFLVLFRNIARLIRTELFAFNVGLTNVLIVGSTKITKELVDSLSTKHSGYRVIGVVSNTLENTSLHVPTYETFQEFLSGRKPLTLHGIIQTELYKDDTRNREVLEYAQTHHTSYRFIPGNTELFVGNIDVELFRNSIPVIAVRQTPLFGWGRIVKRIFDVVFGCIFLVIALPFMLIIAFMVKVSDPKGPVFMRGVQQNRLTRFNRVFKVYKFRTHYAKFDGKRDEEVFEMIGRPDLIKEYRANGDKLDNDFRVTAIGKFLRKASLDELPQLINVVKGDLSLVGPRALIPEELGRYEKKHTILSVKSGLTGLAVVSGRRNIPFEERRKLDVYYVQNWSFWLDLIILLKTVRVVLERTGAK